MAQPDDDPETEDRRTTPNGPVYGRRWDDDEHQRDLFEWARQDLGARLFSLRSTRGWSLEKVALAARMKAETVADAENGRGDPKLSTITRLLAVYGFYTRLLPERRDNVAPRCRGVNRAEAAHL